MSKKKETGGVMDNIRKELNGGPAEKKTVAPAGKKKIPAVKKSKEWTPEDDKKLLRYRQKSVLKGLT